MTNALTLFIGYLLCKALPECWQEQSFMTKYPENQKKTFLAEGLNEIFKG